MRLSFGILVLVLAASVTGCGSSSSDKVANASSGATTSNPPSTTASKSAPATGIPCAGFFASQTKASNLYAKIGASIGSPGKANSLDESLKIVKDEFEALKPGAPSDVQDALSDLEKVYDVYIGVLKNPTSSAASQLRDISTRFAQDGQKIGAYVAAHCAKP
jgi:hypothetical protein